MATHRIKIVINKKKVLIQTAKKEIANLLVEGKEEKACIRAESLIREDFTIEALEILDMLCDLCHERVRYISSNEDCPADIKQAVCSLIYAANKIDVKELGEVKSQFSWKYGSKFIKAAEENEDQVVNERIVKKLSVDPPSAFMVQGYLIDLSQEYELRWTPKTLLEDPNSSPMQPPSGFSIPMAPGSGLDGVYKRSESEVRQEIEQLTIKAHELAEQLPASHTTYVPTTTSDPATTNTDIKVPPTSTDKIVQGLTVPNASQSTSASAQLPTAPTTAATFTPNNNNSSKGGDVKNDNDDDDDNSNNDGNDSKHDGSSIDSSSGNGSGATTLEDLEARFAALRR